MSKAAMAPMETLTGAAVSPGIARGSVFIYTSEILRESYSEGEGADATGADQHERITSAMSDVRHSLETDAASISNALSDQSGDIFRAQSAMMQDSTVKADLDRCLDSGPVDAEEAVRAVFAIAARRFRASSNEILHARADDLEDLSRRLLHSLRGIHAHRLEGLPPGTVLVARRLYPSDTVFLSRSSTVAVIAEFAGPAAHAALLTRELGIPCVGGIAQILDLAHAGDDIIVDGGTGVVVIHPDQATGQSYERVIAAGERARHRPTPIDRRPTITSDGMTVSVMANAWSLEDVELAMRSGADGIGLFRTEPFFMSSKHLPTAEEFAAFLGRSLEPLAGLRVNVRLLDVGADKNPSYLPLPPEADPFLGLRGVRVLLRYPELLDAQLRALLDCSRRFNLGILIPMVSLERDVAQVVARCRELASTLGVQEMPPIGAMIETPAAALTVATLVRHVDFLSIGSNDLTQYTLAAGRENPSVSDYFIDDHASVMRLMELAILDAGTTPISLCGELAGRTTAIPGLLRIGLRSLSVAPSVLTDIRRTIRGTSVAIGDAVPNTSTQ